MLLRPGAAAGWHIVTKPNSLSLEGQRSLIQRSPSTEHWTENTGFTMVAVWPMNVYHEPPQPRFFSLEDRG